MSIGANSYGSTANVAALAPLYATGTGNLFDAATRPTLTQVETMIDQVSAMVNVVLAEQGFAIPVTQADAKAALDGFVDQQVVHLVEFANGSGPFVPGMNEMRYKSPEQRIIEAAQAFVGVHARGFEALGATRSRSLAYGLACGSELDPMIDEDEVGAAAESWADDDN